MSMFRLKLRMYVVAAVLCFGATGAFADDFAWTLSRPRNICLSGPGGIVVGTKIDLYEDILVTKLGWYDHPWSSPGARHETELGIFDVETQQLIVSALLPTGTEPELLEDFRFVPVTPVELTAGRSYMVVGLTFNGESFRHVTPGVNMSVNPIMRATTGWYQDRSTQLICPETLESDLVCSIGPNFMYEIPEPASLCLLGAGALVLCRRRR